MDPSRPMADGPLVEEPSAKLFCCRSVRRWVPLAYREELYHVLRMTGPLLISRFLTYLLPFVMTMFVGRLGNTVLAGYAMASATINVTTAATGLGLCLACDTLVSQTFGGKNLLRVGVILQRSVLILLVFCLPCWALLINTQAILLTLGQEPEVARIAQLYVVAYLPAVPAMFLHRLQVAYLQNQGVILPQVYASIMANIANVATNYILLFWMDLGVKGSAAANTMSQIYICVILFAYIWWKKLYVRTWGGWTTESLQEWGSYMKLAIPSTLMLCFAWWIYEIGGFLAGMLSELDLAAQHVVVMLAYINYMIPLGIQGAACLRVGNALGAGDTAGAILTSKVSLIFSAVLAIFQGLVLGSTKTVIGYIFTSDENIAVLVSRLLNIYCVLQFFDGLVCVSTGTLLGSGQQKIAAVANLFGYYGIGLPLGISLMFATQLQVAGFWLGLLICACLQSCFFITVIFKLNWNKVTEEAVERAGKNECVALMTPVSETELNHLIPESMDLVSNGQSQSVSGHRAVISQQQDGMRGSSVAQERQGVGQEAGDPTAWLSTSQLIIRRGLVVLAAILILAVGTAVHLLLPLPDVSWSTGANVTDWANSTTPSPLLQSMLLI